MNKKTPTPYTDAFLEDLKIKLKNLRITKTAMARAIGTSKQAASRWFNLSQNRKPTGEFVLRIQAYLKDKISMFL